jgi:16S rRNA (cytidine1402-2'-O)-methyltransferase
VSEGRFFVIPWHIGDTGDTTFNAAAAVKRLETLLVEDLADARYQLRECLGVETSGKRLLVVPEKTDLAFLDRVLDALSREDVGMLSSGGTPGFIDPGAWLVAALRERGAAIKALAGPSCLSAMLSLSGIEWRSSPNAFTFAFFLDNESGGREDEEFVERARRKEPLLVFLQATSLERCLRLLAPEIGGRAVTLFFDLTKTPRRTFPLADEVRSLTAARWLEALPDLPWNKVHDVALMVGP